MGDIQMELSRKTLAEFATEVGRNYDTVFRAAKRVIPGAISAGMLLTPEMENEISSAMRSAKSVKKKTGTVRRSLAGNTMAAQGEASPNEATPPVAEKTQENPLFNPTYLKAIIYGHAVLIFADLVILYAIPGAIAGLLVGFFMHSSVSLADRPELNRTSAFALWICAGLDGLAWFVHVPAFRDSVSADVSDLVTQFLAGVVCAMSFAALYALRDSKLD